MPSRSLASLNDPSKLKVTEVVSYQLNHIPIIKGHFESLSEKAQLFIAEKADLLTPRAIYICDGSEAEYKELIGECLETGVLTPLKAYKNNYLCRTDPRDVARVESKTWMITPEKYDSVCHTAEGVKSIMGQWMSPEQFGNELDDRFPGCMNGRTMYVVPFSMGPVGGPLSKIGIELTDSVYVVLCMKIMTRMGARVWDLLKKSGGDFVRCIHSVGQPRPVLTKIINSWPCNPEKTIIAHLPAQREIWSFGSGYGGNSLLGKKCFALRIAMNIGYDEGWMAEHMLIMGITSPQGKERFVCAAFPSACGKTNLAMLEPAVPGWKVRVVGDDIAWMKFGADGRLYAINPEAGFFGVAPGTSHKTNPMAMASFQENSVFTNVAETADGEYFWEGLEKEVKNPKVDMIDWLGKPWHLGDSTKSSHPNSRFTAPAGQCPIIHPDWEKPEGVPIDAIIFGGRRPEGVPLVFESRSWVHGIFVGACVKSEATAAAEFSGKQIMHDPMAMRPFMGYNFGRYMRHWMKLGQPPHKVPKIFHVNWFRTTADGKFLWPGYGENIRVLDWILRRCDGDDSIGFESPIGYIPKEGSINLSGLPNINWAELMSLPKKYWVEDMEETKHFFEQQVGSDLPPEIAKELEEQTARIKAMP
ncbi:phosphoenolpyruvate carboxykinase [GTP], putative [Brugia malayi]|uniref:Phosphoenolpyruvate carboxykinase [GTP] n=1 Tax=Brugia malayi TaxID=6279 RepID=A0A8L7TCE3_BRUMA|nr:phosphoenolpyruvate carboxykinase [GTP], putative [Brugia malayi]VIO92675.1 phosphoenolpyruvate carboxykinase [GTP], putative [Brugia malayi]